MPTKLRQRPHGPAGNHPLDGQSALPRLFELQRRYNGLYATYLTGQVNRTLDPADKENTFQHEWQYRHYFSAGADALRLPSV